MTITLEGRLDALTSPQLDAELQGAYEGVKLLVFEFKNLAYISSAGLRIVLAAQKVMSTQGTMIIRNACDEIRDIFDVTGFSDILILE